MTLKRPDRRNPKESGFTVIEVMAALLVFSLLTLGLTPLLLSSIKGSALSQSYTVGKNLALEAMERVRGLPYYVAYSAQDSRVDVLDLYYPSYVAGGVFTTTCTSADTAVPACPKRIPDDYSVIFEATFVKAEGTELTQTYTPVDDYSTSYSWDSATTDLPPSQIIEMLVTVRWTRGGETKQSALRTLISDRKFGEVIVHGTAKIDYGIQARSGYIDPTGAASMLTATGGNSEAFVESKTTSTATETVRASELRLVEVPADPAEVGADIGLPVEGAKGTYLAPPNSSPSDQTAGAASLTHTNLDPATDIAGIASTQAKDMDVAVVTELPAANGTFVTGDPGIASDDLWVAPQVSSDMATALKLNTSRPLFFVRPDGSDAMSGSTAAVTTALTAAERKVESTANMSLTDVRLLPTTFISDTTAERSVIDITSFSASVSCKSTADSSTATKSATWNATLRYWQDSSEDGVLNGSYTTLNLSGAAASDLLPGVGNPLVYDAVLPEEDVYLFEDVANDKLGYLSSWGSLFDSSTTGVTGDANGEVTNAAIDGALSIKTAATGSSADSGVQVDVGKLSCEAVDSR